MLVQDNTVLWTASDLAGATECEFALLHQLDVRLGRRPRPDRVEDALLRKLAALGDRHEAVELERLIGELGEYDAVTGRGVRTIERPQPYTPEVLAARAAETHAAFESGADVVYQAAFFDGSFHGFADFVVRDGEGRYRVCDAKLARHERPRALLQLAAYAHQLEASGVPVSSEVELLLGTGRRATFALAEIAPVFRERRDRMLEILTGHLAGDDRVVWGAGDVLACGHCDVCAEQIEEHRDLLLVAGMRMTQRRRLLDAGITTIEELASGTGGVDHLSPKTLTKLRAQAALQVTQVRRGDGVPEVHYDVFDPAYLQAIPTPSPGDLFFDFEGDPMWNGGNPDDWGLEYLFGVTAAPVLPGGRGEFTAFWAHDRTAEKQALEDFVAFVTKRRAAHPDMHVYHYAAYEKSALTRLAARHSTCEDEIDDLLRAGVLVDLYGVVRGALRVSQPSYSIKKLEPLYMGDDPRSGEVTDAAASIVEYHEFRAALAAGEDAAAEEILGRIRDYNQYDCDSTLGLRDWLLARAAEHGVEPKEPGEVPVPELSASAAETAALETALREGLPDTDRTPDQQALAMLAAAVAFNRRELKPFWWAHYDRLGTPIGEWGDQRDVFIVESAQVLGEWAKPSPKSQPHRQVRLTGRWGAGSTVRADTQVKSVYDTPDACHDVPEHSLLGCSRSSVRVTSVEADEEARDVVVIDETLPKTGQGYAALPVALVPGDPVRMGAIDTAIRQVAQSVLDAGRQLPDQPALDILRRRAPNTGGVALPSSGEVADDIHDAVRLLQDSYLAVQGPPGTGKTWVGSRVVARLVTEHGWRVGVVAQGHAVVENMLDAIVDAGVPAVSVAKKIKDPEASRLWTGISDNGYLPFLDAQSAGCVVGGTAWDFVNESRIPRGGLDLLVIDEAGQFSLAHTIGVSVSAQRLLLLGDPQQLPQVSQGTHPEPVNDSALGWLIGDHATLPPERGMFLATTWRMHPDLCAKDSRLSYEGRLHSEVAVTAGRSLDGVDPGLEVVRVHHTGRSTESPEEAAEVAAQVERLVGTPWTAPDLFEGTRLLEAKDFLVVAPYNAQVNVVRHALAERGLADVRCGTVDKFQGQQAPVVIVSMTASAAGDVPRGMDFLLNRNRINVAISRAQWLAVVVRSHALTQFMPTTPHGLLELGAFLALEDG